MSNAGIMTHAMAVIGHGVDLIEVARIESMLSDHGDRFRQRVFTSGEQAYAEQGSKRQAERYAVRFAAKEAALKALGTGWRDGIAWTDIEVRSLPSGQPTLVVTGKALEIARDRGIDAWQVSLTHVETMAMASVLAGRAV